MKKDGDFSRDERMTSLIADLTWIATGWAPEPLMLEDSPLLEQWHWNTYPESADPALAGIVTGHPIRGGGTTIETPPVLAFGVSGNWVRTASRLYRLGKARADG